MRRLDVTAKPGDFVYVLYPQVKTLGPYAVIGPVEVIAVTVQSGVHIYRVKAFDPHGNQMPPITDDLVYSSKEEALATVREMNQGLKNERILLLRSNYLWQLLIQKGISEEYIVNNMPKDARREVVSRTDIEVLHKVTI